MYEVTRIAVILESEKSSSVGQGVAQGCSLTPNNNNNT